MGEGVLILEPGDERAKKIGKAMANKSATAILSSLKEKDLTLSEISERMDQPMTTVKYHVENLLDAELIEVRKIRYSEKGREVKVYGVNERLVIVAPSGGDIKDTLLKYASVFALLLIATLAMVAVSPAFDLFSTPQGVSKESVVWETSSDNIMATGAYDDTRNAFLEGENQTFKTSDGYLAAEKGQADNVTSHVPGTSGAGYDTVSASTRASTPVPTLAETGSDAMIHLFVIAFFLGGCLILAIMLLYEAFIWRREKKFWDELGKKEE